jgi:hypothetical protein
MRHENPQRFTSVHANGKINVQGKAPGWEHYWNKGAEGKSQAQAQLQ